MPPNLGTAGDAAQGSRVVTGRSEGATNLARYFAKQFGCMLAGQDLDVPADLINFLNGAGRCPSVCFMIFRNWRGMAGHRIMRRHGSEQGLTTFVGYLQSTAFKRDERLMEIDFGYHVGYVWILVDWTEDSDRSSWFEHRSIEMPKLNARLRDKITWLPVRIRMEASHLTHNLSGSDAGLA